jgi:C_GCAxxG_C_C family probable redox protein
MKNHDHDSVLNRRDMLKISLAAGVTLATTGLTGISQAAEKAAVPANRPEHAKERFLKTMNCSQAILETYSPQFGISVETARKLATGFAGGMGIGSECGAVTAALMVIGLKHGPKENNTFPHINEFLKEFKARHKEIGCSQLLGVDMGTPEGVKRASKAGYFTSHCPGYVKTAAEILEKMMA